MATKISILVLASNNEATIQTCIDTACQVTDDVVVLLNNSEDRTREILRENPQVNTVNVSWTGYGDTKNKGIDHCRYDYVFSLDADEALSQECIKYLKSLECKKNTVYRIKRKNHLNGKWVKYSGWYPDWVYRLYPKEGVLWSEDRVHESLEYPKNFTLIDLEGDILHHPYTSMDHYREKLDKYAKLKAMNVINKGKKPSWGKRLMGGSFRFFKSLILRKGFLDGRAGWIIAKMNYTLIRKEIAYFYKHLP